MKQSTSKKRNDEGSNVNIPFFNWIFNRLGLSVMYSGEPLCTNADRPQSRKGLAREIGRFNGKHKNPGKTGIFGTSPYQPYQPI
jgi:hypothetical protein